jgi:predicted RNase H-like nuclease (RuvC/YqgF family)
LFESQVQSMGAKLAAAHDELEAVERDCERLEAELTREQAKVTRLEDDLVHSREQTAQSVRKSAELLAAVACIPLLEQQADAGKFKSDQLEQSLGIAKTKLEDCAEAEKKLNATVAERDQEIAELEQEIAGNRELIAAIHDLARAQKVIAAKTTV